MKVGFDIDNYDFTEYASALDGENLSSTDCDMGIGEYMDTGSSP